MRSLLLAVEARLGEEMKPTEPLAQFIPEFAAYLINRLLVGKDGKTAIERIKGKRATVVGVEFGEKLLFKMPKQAKMAKMKQRWDYGIFVVGEENIYSRAVQRRYKAVGKRSSLAQVQRR